MVIRKALVGGLLSVSATWAMAAHAQSEGAAPVAASADGGSQAAADEAGAGDDIVVTAQKRSEKLSDVPLSVTAASGDQLAKQGISSPADLVKAVPGLFFQQSTFGVPVYSIRGIGFYSTFIGAEPTVTIYNDQVPLPYSIMASGAAVDLERVEVLKGPQGTLFGQNATGGAINYVAAKPTRDLQAGFSATYGRFNQADVDGYISGPITDTVRARLFVRKETRGDWQYSETRHNAVGANPPFLSAHGDDTHGQRDFMTGRFLLDWDASDKISLEFGANGWRDRSDTIASQYEGYYPQVPQPDGYPEHLVITGLPLAANRNRAADWDAGDDFTNHFKFYQFSLRGNIELGDNLNLTSITAYSHFKGTSRTESDGTFFNDFVVIETGEIGSFSQELRLAGQINDRLQFQIGGNYQHDKNDGDEGSNFTASNSGLGPYRFHVLDQPLNQRIDTYAGFGSAEYKITDQLTLQGALRYTEQKRDLVRACFRDPGDGNLAFAFNHFTAPFLVFLGRRDPSFPDAVPGGCVTFGDRPQDGPGLPFLSNVTAKLNEHNLSWRTSLNWKPDENTLLYANLTKGYKAGTFPSVTAVFSSQYTPIKQESVLAYEAGFKVEPIRHIQISGAVFYYDYKDKQLQGIVEVPSFGRIPKLISIPKSAVKGAEIEVTARPIEGLRLSGGITYIDSKVKEAPPLDPVSGQPTVIDRILGPFDITGASFPGTPKWNGVGSIEYSFPVSSNFNAFVGGDMTYRSKTLAQFSISPQFKIDGYALFDLRAGFETADGKVRVQFWGHNITNKYYWVQATAVADTFFRTAGMPATYGVTVSGKF